jgi:hypothetical protein
MSNPNMRLVLTGIIATLTMDVLSGGAIKLQLISPLPPRLIGRWFASVAKGQPFHHDIGQVSPVNYEMAIALPVHYAIGVTLALAYVLATSALGLSPRNPFTALSFGLITNVLPWLVMFPAMGYGWFGAHCPPGTRLFVSSLISHCLFGLGLWTGASLLI